MANLSVAPPDTIELVRRLRVLAESPKEFESGTLAAYLLFAAKELEKLMTVIGNG